MAKHNDEGERFEAEIASLFRAAGYVVEQRVQLGAKEFDLVATKAAFGGMDLRIAVECKYREGRDIGSSAVNEFVSAFIASKDKHNLSFGILVSSRGFARNAQVGLREHAQIKALTRDQLDDELLGARAFLENAPTSYRTDATSYIVLSGQRHSPQKRVIDVAATCVQRLSSSGQSFTLILGDFGTGKTTIAERVHRELSKRYLAGESSSFPLLLYLRTLDQSDSENNFIDQHLKSVSNQLGIQQLEMLRKRGGLTFILDGYDEVGTNAREEDRLRLSSRVMRLINRADRVLMTSRPTYFTSIDELNNLVQTLMQRDFAPPEDLQRPTRRADGPMHEKLTKQFEIVRTSIIGGPYRTFSAKSAETYFINPLNREDVITYFRPHSDLLKRKYKLTPEETYELLAGIYDVTDLLTRPLLLQMFVVLLREGDLNLGSRNNELGPAELYALYVNLHLNREWNLKKFLTPDERRAFARTLAIAILEAGGSLEATYEGLATIIRTGEAAFEPARRSLLNVALADVVTDVRICAFINMTRTGRLEFSHKSFMEYFVAEVVINGLSERKLIPVLEKNLNYEILYFLGSFCITWPQYRLNLMHHLRDIGYKQNDIYRTNIKIALLFSERISVEREYREIHFARVRLSKRSFEACEFFDFALLNGQYFDLQFQSCQFHEFMLEGEAVGVSIEGCTGSFSMPSQMQKVDLTRCKHLVLSAGESGRQLADDISLIDCYIVLENMHAEWSKAVVTRGSITLGVGAMLKLTSGSLRDVTFTSDALRGVQLDLSGCVLRGVTFNAVQISANAFAERGGKFSSCRGLLLVDDKSKGFGAFTWQDDNKKSRYHGFLVDGPVFFDLETFEGLPENQRSILIEVALSRLSKPKREDIENLVELATASKIAANASPKRIF